MENHFHVKFTIHGPPLSRNFKKCLDAACLRGGILDDVFRAIAEENPGVYKHAPRKEDARTSSISNIDETKQLVAVVRESGDKRSIKCRNQGFDSREMENIALDVGKRLVMMLGLRIRVRLIRRL